MLGLSETKLKGGGEFRWEKVRGIKGGVRDNQWAKEGVAILMSERMWSLVVEYKVVSSRIGRVTIPEAKECVKDRREWRRIVGGDVDDPW